MIVLMLFVSFLSLACGPDTQKILNRAKFLAAQKKYKTAYDLLVQSDPQNKYPDLVIERVKILMDGAIYDFESKNFYFIDPTQILDWASFNQAKSHSQACVIQPEALLNHLIEKYPDAWGVYQTLGEYYVWLSRYEEMYSVQAAQGYLVVALEKLTPVLDHQALDGDGLYALGVIYSQQQELLKAVDCFNQAQQKGNHSAELYYALAQAQETLGQNVQSINSAQKAYGLYTDIRYKEASALLIATNYNTMKDFDNYEKCLLSAQKDLPQSVTLTNWLIDAYIKNGEMKNAEDVVETILNKSILDPSTLPSLSGMFEGKVHQKEFSSFLKRMKKKYGGKKNVLAGLYFCEGMVQLSSGKEKDASAAFKKSESIAKTLNPPSPDFIKWLRSDEFKEFVKEKGFVRLYSNGN